jgi:hypothetical protein
MIVATRLEADPDRPTEVPKGIGQTPTILGTVQHSHAAAAGLAGHSDQHFMPVRGNVDADQNTGSRTMLNLGHGGSPRWCGSQNHHRDPSLGYGRSIPTCYGTDFTRKASPKWTSDNGPEGHYIDPDKPQQTGDAADRGRSRPATQQTGDAAGRRHRVIQRQSARPLRERGNP